MKCWAVLLDFDGTITTRDISDCILSRFTPLKLECIRRLRRSGKVTEEWVRRNYLRIKNPACDIRDFSSRIMKPRAGFGRFIGYLRKKSHPLEIISGGFDLYVDLFLGRMGLADAKRYCARAVPTGRGLLITYPFLDGAPLEEFKASRVRHFSGGGFRTLYVGDGQSDFEAAKIADVVFARGTLMELLKRDGRPARRFENFVQLLDWMRRQKEEK